MEQITELLKKYHDLKLRDDSRLYEDIEGNLYIKQVSSELMLKVQVQKGDLTVIEIKDIPKNLSVVRDSSMMRGD